MKATHVIAALAAIALGVALGLALSGPSPQLDAALQQQAAADNAQTAGNAGMLPGRERPPAGIAPVAGKLRPRNLFADYQLALGSSDLREIERGLAAVRSCTGIAGDGTEDIDAWATYILPPGLSPEETHRRSQFARAFAARCNDFALQAGAVAQLGDLSDKALSMGSASERLVRLFYTYDGTNLSGPAWPQVSCQAVRDYPHSANDIPYIVMAALMAAERRPSHLLNQIDSRARDLALHLASCDLDPASCERFTSNVVGTACVQQGKCDYADEMDYWRSETPPDVYAQAQSLRQAWVAAVRNGDCAALFD